MKKILYSLLIFVLIIPFCQGLTKAELTAAAERYIEFITQAGKNETSLEWCIEQINELYVENSWKKSNNRSVYSNRNQFIQHLAEAKGKKIVWTHTLTVPIRINVDKKTITITSALQVESYGRVVEPIQILYYDEDGRITGITQTCAL